jgi:hypothetical protein
LINSFIGHLSGNISQVAGWGHTENGTFSEELLEAKMKVQNHTECYLKKRSFFKKNLRPGKNFCAGGEGI